MHLILEKGKAVPPNRALRPDEVVSLGRGLDNAVVLPDKCASKRHARIFSKDGRWFIRDLGSRNGVLVNGRRVAGEAELAPDAQIVIGDIHLRLTADGETGANGAVQAEACPDGETVLHPDDLSGLYRFLSGSLKESEPYALVRSALDTLQRQTRADLVGFRGLDADDLLIVLPEAAEVDARLSSRMTQRALDQDAAVWLAGPEDSALSGESLAGLCDALCVPLRASDAADEGPLGALHAYRLSQPFTEREVRFGQVLAACLAGCLRGVRDRRALRADNSRLRLGSPGGDDALVGDSPAMNALRAQIAALADRPVSVLITGETGVGKELVALGLHRASRRRNGPLVTVNCASLNPATAIAEMFGHVSGAFTDGRAEHPGFFQQADGGTLFLDEIGDLSADMQAALLRALETHVVRPMKSAKDIKVDVRVLAATNRDLTRQVQAGKFRDDLLYRFSVSIHAPPLRDHAEDIPALVEHFLRILRRQDPRPLTLTAAALERLRACSWPGNVRRLKHVLEAAAAFSADGRIDAANLRLPDVSPAAGPEIPLNLEELEAWAIRRALERTAGNNVRAAELLGIHRDTLNAKVRKYQIPRPNGVVP